MIFPPNQPVHIILIDDDPCASSIDSKISIRQKADYIAGRTLWPTQTPECMCMHCSPTLLKQMLPIQAKHLVH